MFVCGVVLLDVSIVLVGVLGWCFGWLVGWLLMLVWVLLVV